MLQSGAGISNTHSTLTNIIENNATVCKVTRNPNRGERDGGHKNGRRRGSRDGGRGYGGRGGRHDYTHPTALRPNAAVSPPPQYAQGMVIPPPLILILLCHHQWLLIQWVVPNLNNTRIAFLLSETHGAEKIVLYYS